MEHKVKSKKPAVLIASFSLALLGLATASISQAQTTAAGVMTESAVAADPQQWLEDVTGEKALDWVKARNQVTRSKLDSDAGFIKLRSDLQVVLNSKDRIPTVNKMGNYYYNFWMDADHPRGVWRKTTLDEYRKPQPKWETVLDIDALAKVENENWVFKNSNCRDPVYDRCLIQLSRGGADAVVMREFDLTTQSFIKDGFTLPEAKMNIDWRDKDTLFVGTNFGEGSLTDSGYPRIVKEWKRGTPISSAKTLLAGEKTDISVSARSYDQDGIHHEIVSRGVTFYTSEEYLKEGSKLTRLDVPAKSNISFFGKQFVVSLREAWITGGKTYATGSLLAIDFDAYKKGKRNFNVLFQPTDTSSLNGEAITKHYLLVQSLNNVKSNLTEWQLKKGKWVSREVALPTLGSVGVSAIDANHSDDYFLSYSDYLTPSVYILAHAGNDQRETLKSAPSFFDATPYETVQKFATSKDGTKVPYFMVRNKDVKYDGNNPTLLYGYGGFEISLTPAYSGSLGKTWLEKGGVYVVANIRGGGEYGPRWHEAALKENRQRAYDDFAAVADDLIASKITSPQHLGAMGGSNGGLLAGVALTQHPELFNAVVSQVPLLDMQRFNKLLAGASWMGEYGNPDIPAEWDYISRYSPYQNVKAGVKYPNVLFITSTRDDRVHPGHARKMAAKMISQGHDNVWYYENIEGGHGGAANNAQRADMAAITYSFLWNMLKRDNADVVIKR
ncbi:prolyl oligopeptidase family serine peptidase [Undibacterium sp. 5I1]|uniref:prolyl oligopeptidase family serine peptidase n=1 Tax=unclassified Undibacterium TaxID=2630295 RepID=UPI002AB4D8CD|nr:MULTISPECIES: prolyl oligopeptidase family serine peptidase [unclassified Undibacterium]MDY7539198.1 prolyl oligopeptidase family serine peptidase [Undibacterium sp. 5I1]MEB0231131.1 prolyl oligopeptidase family serine peptidase [Undibacterium sp. 10I3]MEB0257004.1 prolyl oligopeptidase family serine peptidase [Undibacterium sp. 5I1]